MIGKAPVPGMLDLAMGPKLMVCHDLKVKRREGRRRDSVRERERKERKRERKERKEEREMQWVALVVVYTPYGLHHTPCTIHRLLSHHHWYSNAITSYDFPTSLHPFITATGQLPR